MAGNSPANRPNGTVAKVSHEQALATMGEFRNYLGTRAESETRDIATDLAADQLAAVIAAEDEAAMWAADEMSLEAGKDLADREMMVQSFTVHTSSERFKAPLGHYVVVQAVRLDTGEAFTWNTGSPLVIGKLRWLEAHGKLPRAVVLRSIETPNGARLRLEPVAVRATPAAAS